MKRTVFLHSVFLVTFKAFLFAQIKLQLLTLISQKNSSIVDVSSLEQTSATVVTLIDNTDELVPDAKVFQQSLSRVMTFAIAVWPKRVTGFIA